MWGLLCQPTCINHTLSKRGRLVVLSKNFNCVVIHKRVLFLNFEFEKKKKKKGGRVGNFFLDRSWDSFSSNGYDWQE